MNKKNRSHQLIFNQMKECLIKEGLPVFGDKHHCAYNPFRFSSNIQKGRYTADILCWYEADKHYANMIIHGKYPSVFSVTDIMEMANYINGGLSQYHVAPHLDYYEMMLRAGLYVSGEELPADKFSWLLSSMIRDGERIHSYLENSMSKKSLNYDDLPRFSNAFSDCDPSDPRFSKTLDGIAKVLNKLDLSIQNDFKNDKSFCLELGCEGVPNLIVRIGIRIEDDPDRVLLFMTPRDTIPEEKIPVIMELISRINELVLVDHMHLHFETFRTIIRTGVLLIDGVLDVKEFERALRTLLGNGSVYLSMVLEQLSSAESPEDLLYRMFIDPFEKRTNRH